MLNLTINLLANIVSGSPTPDGTADSLRTTLLPILICVAIFGVFIFLMRKFYTPNDNSSDEENSTDEEETKLNTAQDGHNVDSDMEVRIDDVLFNSCILHSYGASIEGIIEKRKKCDWFIPITNDQGIYIEYWSMKTQKYLEDRKEREELYKKYDIPYIGIEADDPKQDTQTFKSNLIRDITKLAIERYGFIPRWKK